MTSCVPHNICSVSFSFIWDRESYLAKGYVFEVSFRLSPVYKHIYAHICTHASQTQKFSYQFYQTAAYVIRFHCICTFGKQTPKSQHGQVFTEVQMHAERFLPTKDRYMHTKDTLCLLQLLCRTYTPLLPTLPELFTYAEIGIWTLLVHVRLRTCSST